jgi:cardiolipin synthase
LFHFCYFQGEILLIIAYRKDNVNQQISHRFLTIPNLLSIFRILLIFPIAYYVWNDKLKIVIIFVVLSVISDYLDGIIARRFNQISEWGKILDPLADKLAAGILLIVLYLKHEVPLWLVIIVVGRDVLILLVGLFFAEKYKFVIPSNFLGKVTANVLAIMIISYIFNITILEKIFTPLAIVMIFLSGLGYLKNLIKIQKTGEQG